MDHHIMTNMCNHILIHNGKVNICAPSSVIWEGCSLIEFFGNCYKQMVFIQMMGGLDGFVWDIEMASEWVGLVVLVEVFHRGQFLK